MLQLFHQLKGNLPSVLYVQMDNTCRDNKNKYMLMFAALLVELGVFRKVKFGFLPVGHTHEDIDQLFSCVSRQLKHRNALTIPELSSAIGASFSPEPKVVVLDLVVDAKGWMSEQTPPLHDHLKAHQFKFEQNQTGKTRMYYKEWSTDPFWLPQTGLTILPTDHPTPTQQPLMIRPHYDQDNIKKLEATLRKVNYQVKD